MNILIATGIYPPDIGGPAKYAATLEQVWKKRGHHVSVVTYGAIGKRLPVGVRHALFFLKLLRYVFSVQQVIILDTFSAALPAIIFAKLFHKKTILRTGGDFLWEQYVERTHKKVLLRNFYQTELRNLTRKERLIYSTIKYILHACDSLVFSTKWQYDIFLHPYTLESKKNVSIIGNYAHKTSSSVSREHRNKVIVANTRNIVWKNIDVLAEAFRMSGLAAHGYSLDTQPHSPREFETLLKTCKAAVLVSIGDISPNMILEALSVGTPCIVTREIGILDAVGHSVELVDPMHVNEIVKALKDFDDPDSYEKLWEKTKTFTYNQSWESIGSAYETLMIG